MAKVIEAKEFTIVGIYGLGGTGNEEVIFDYCIGCTDEKRALDCFWEDIESPLRRGQCCIAAVIEGHHENLIEEMTENGPISYANWIEHQEKKPMSLADEIESVLNRHISEHGENASLAKFLRKCLRPIITSAEGEEP